MLLSVHCVFLCAHMCTQGCKSRNPNKRANEQNQEGRHQLFTSSLLPGKGPLLYHISSASPWLLGFHEHSLIRETSCAFKKLKEQKG